MNYKDLGLSIVNLMGGKENISLVTHCATRLRFEVIDENKVKVDDLKKLTGVFEVNQKFGQIQVVIGNEVQNVFYEVSAIVGQQEKNKKSESKQKWTWKGCLSSIIDVISSVFSPILPALCGCSMLKAVLIILTTLNIVSADSTTYTIITFASDTVFYFLPILLAFSAAKKFNCSAFLAVIIAGVLLHPSFTAMQSLESAVTLFGLPVKLVSYSASVIPIIIGVWIMSYVERFAEKVTPNFVKFFIKPLIVLAVMVPVMLVVVGPAGAIAGEYLAKFVMFLSGKSGWFMIIFLSTVSPLIVISGMQYALFPLVFQSFASLGYDVIMGVTGLATNLGQGGACFAVALKTKNKEFRQLAISAGLTACFGISEPALYGVTLKLKKPFYAVLFSGFVGGVYAAFTALRAYALISPGLMAFPGYIQGGSINIMNFFICCALSFAAAFIATLVLGFEDPEEDKIDVQEEKLIISKEILDSPLEGVIIPLSEVNDKIFSDEIMGKGVAIIPSSGKVVSPCNGVVTALFDTKHAIGITSDSGLEILIHIGLDTANLKGEYFKNLVEKGASVKKGELLLEFDLDSIIKAGYDCTTPIIIANSNDLNVKCISSKKEIQNNIPLLQING